ncbi:NADH dehydrogenase [ubiquinone] 1 alpha subcomplex subunit 10, mitochondrial [Anthophora plagiata]
MTSLLAVNVLKGNGVGYLTRLCKISKSHNVIQVASMKRLSLKEELPKPKPLPYWKTTYSTFKLRNDPTAYRYDENSKLIIVDGLPATGKTKVCEKLAEEFGLLYMPPPTHDEIYINAYGYDFRQLDPKLPIAVQSCDLKLFLKNPLHPQVPCFQLNWLYMRFEQYINAMLHVLATGQGVVLNRSIYSDIAFSDAMYNAGYLSKGVVTEFNVMKKNGLGSLLKPHLVIYLDSPPEVVQQNIKKRGNMDEINSKVFTTQYLLDMDKSYKEKCLTWLSPYTRILMYDWSKESNMSDVIMDIENLDLEEHEAQDMFEDWVFIENKDIHILICECQNKHMMFSLIDQFTKETTLTPELWYSPYDTKAYFELLETVESEKYEPGYNPIYGDKVLFKQKFYNYQSVCRRTPRDLVNYSEAKLPY